MEFPRKAPDKKKTMLWTMVSNVIILVLPSLMLS